MGKTSKVKWQIEKVGFFLTKVGLLDKNTIIISQRFRFDAKTEPFFMSMTIHSKFIKTELKLV